MIFRSDPQAVEACTGWFIAVFCFWLALGDWLGLGLASIPLQLSACPTASGMATKPIMGALRADRFVVWWRWPYSPHLRLWWFR